MSASRLRSVALLALISAFAVGGGRAFSLRFARQSDASAAQSQQQTVARQASAFNNFNPQSVAASFSSAGRPGFPPELGQQPQHQQQFIPQQQQHQQPQLGQIPFVSPPQPQVQFAGAIPQPQQQPQPLFPQQQQQQQQQFVPQQPQQQPQVVGAPVPVLPPLASAAVPSPQFVPQQQQEQQPQQQFSLQQPISGPASQPPAEPTTAPTTTTPKTTPPPPVDKNVDLDGDGALSLAEVQYAAFVHHGLSSSVVENLFNQVDQNKDGYLNSIEFNEIRPLVLTKAENAAQRYLQNVDTDHNGLLSLPEAQAYILKEYGISNRDVERIWRLVVPSSGDEMDAVLFSKLRRRVRGMSIRLARQIMKMADRNEDGHIDLKEAQAIAFEQEGIGAGDVVEMLASVDDNNDGELNAPEFADFERIVRARAVDTSKKALKVVDTDGSGTLTMDEAKQIAFDHYGFDEATLEPFFAQADENEDGQLDAVEFAGFRSVIRSRAVKNALATLPEIDEDGNGAVSLAEAERKARQDDDMDAKEAGALFGVADQDRNGQLDKVELADFLRLVRLSAIKFVSDHFRDYDSNRDKLVTIEELEGLVRDRYKVDTTVTRRLFDKADVDRSGDLSPGEIVDFRHEIRRYVADRNVHAELEAQNRREMAEIEAKLRSENEQKSGKEGGEAESDDNNEEGEDDTPVLNAEPETATGSTDVPMKGDSTSSTASTAVSASEQDENSEMEVDGGAESAATTQVQPTQTTSTAPANASEEEEEEGNEEDAMTAAEAAETTTTTTTTIAPTTTTVTAKAHKKRRRPKTKTTSAPSEGDAAEATTVTAAPVDGKDMSMSDAANASTSAPAPMEDAAAAARAKSVPKRRRKLKKTDASTSTTTTMEPTTTTTTPTTTTTTPTTTTTTTTTTEAPTTAAPAATEAVEYEECKEGDTDCEPVAE